MQFVHLLQAISTGLVQQIPIVGPVIQSILAERSQAALEQRLVDVIQRLASSQEQALVIEANHPTLLPALLMAEAEIEHRLTFAATPHRRFLYLASDEYASAVNTYEIAVKYSFLWRSFHNVDGAAIANVGRIAVGDIIALGYRTNGAFRLLLPLVVHECGPYSLPINTGQFPNRVYSPFVWANDAFSQVLKTDYDVDPLFQRQTGLNVRPLFAEISKEQAVAALQGSFPSPGINAIWVHDNHRVPELVRDWIKSL